MISYGSVEVSIIFTINLFLSDHTGTLPIFSEKMVLMFARHGHCTESWLHKIFIIYFYLNVSTDRYIKRHCVDIVVQNFQIFYGFFVWQFVVDIWMRYIFISISLRLQFCENIKIIKYFSIESCLKRTLFFLHQKVKSTDFIFNDLPHGKFNALFGQYKVPLFYFICSQD